jgi:cell division protein FtsA
MSLSDNLIVGLDIGTANVRAIIGEIDEEGALAVTGVGSAPSTGGLRRGVVVNIEATLKAVSQAVENAELMSGREVQSCYVGIAGAHIEAINSRGVVAVTGKGKEITQDDVDRVIEAAKAIVIPMDREILHVIPQMYIVDDQKGIKNPLDMIGVRLEAEVHIITGSVTCAQNLVNCVNRSGFKVDGLVLQSLAASRAVLTDDEKELGCLLIDLGAGTTDVFVFMGGSPYYANVIPAGGSQVTGDLSIMLALPADAAEKIKLESGCCYEDLVDDDDEVIIPSVGGRPPRRVPRRELSRIMQPRVEEILTMVRDKIDGMGYLSHLGGGVVLTGGCANMPGIAELAFRVFRLPVRIGVPAGLGGLVDEFKNPEYATAVGLVLAGLGESRERETGPKPRKEGKPGGIAKFSEWLKREFF